MSPSQRQALVRHAFVYGSGSAIYLRNVKLPKWYVLSGKEQLLVPRINPLRYGLSVMSPVIKHPSAYLLVGA